MVERVNSRVLGDAKNSFAFGVNAPLGWYGGSGFAPFGPTGAFQS